LAFFVNAFVLFCRVFDTVYPIKLLTSSWRVCFFVSENIDTTTQNNKHNQTRYNMKKTLVATGIILGLLAAPTTQAASTYSKTKYPVVLAHGMMGWDTMLGIEYWYQIPNDLRNSGANVYTTQASGLESSEVRGEQLLKQVKDILAISGQTKVNLIGHSHGGHSVRYVAAMIPANIASVTTMATPAKGAPMADLIINGGAVGSVATTVIQAAGTMLNLLNGGSKLGLDVNANKSLVSLSTKGSAAFNAKFPQAIPTTACGEGAYEVNGVKYFSFAGISPKTITHFRRWLEFKSGQQARPRRLSQTPTRRKFY
jgi:triacylglycerol lipase